MLDHLISHGLEAAWRLLHVRHGIRRTSHHWRMLSVLNELDATAVMQARILNDLHYGPEELSQILVQFQLRRAQVVFGQFFQRGCITASFWTEVDGKVAERNGASLQSHVIEDLVPADRGQVPRVVPIDDTPCGKVFRKPELSPLYLANVKEEWEKVTGGRSDGYHRKVGSLVAAAVMFNETPVGVVKIEAKAKNTFIKTPSLDRVVRRVAGEFGAALTIGFHFLNQAKAVAYRREHVEGRYPPGIGFAGDGGTQAK